MWRVGWAQLLRGRLFSRLHGRIISASSKRWKGDDQSTRKLTYVFEQHSKGLLIYPSRSRHSKQSQWFYDGHAVDYAKHFSAAFKESGPSTSTPFWLTIPRHRHFIDQCSLTYGLAWVPQTGKRVFDASLLPDHATSSPPIIYPPTTLYPQSNKRLKSFRIPDVTTNGYT